MHAPRETLHMICLLVFLLEGSLSSPLIVQTTEEPQQGNNSIGASDLPLQNTEEPQPVNYSTLVPTLSLQDTETPQQDNNGTLSSGIPLQNVEEPEQENVTTLHISNNDFVVSSKLHSAPVTNIQIDFSVTFSKSVCCPLLYFDSVQENISEFSSNATKKCYKIGYSQRYAELNGNIVPLWHSTLYPNCIRRNDTYICSGTRIFTSVDPRYWFVSLRYSCGKMRPLNAINVTLKVQVNKPEECHDLPPSVGCDYDKAFLPTSQGAFKPVKVGKALKKLLDTAKGFNCYQHQNDFLCHSLFPQCTGNGNSSGDGLVTIFPVCRKMCVEMLTGCQAHLATQTFLPECDVFPDSVDHEVCYYKPIKCLIPKVTQNASLIYNNTMLHDIVVHNCQGKYAYASCGYSGDWNSSLPKCDLLFVTSSLSDPRSNNAAIISVICMVLLGAILGIMALLVIIKRRSPVKAKHFANKINPTYPPVFIDDHKKSIFLTYSSKDNNIIHEKVLPDIKKVLPMWDVMTYETDFLPGRRVTECIEQSVAYSDAIVILLTKNYIDSDWCMLELNHAQIRARRDPAFKIIFLWQEDTLSMDEPKLPVEDESLVSDTLKFSDGLFPAKLRKCLEA